MRRRYPYRRGCTRRWCRMCKVPRFARLMTNRDAHLCLTCGTKTTGFDEFMYDQEWWIHVKVMTREEVIEQYGLLA